MAARPRRSRGVLAALLLVLALAAIVGAGVIGWAIGQAGGEEAATVTTTVIGMETEPPGEERGREGPDGQGGLPGRGLWGLSRSERRGN